MRAQVEAQMRQTVALLSNSTSFCGMTMEAQQRLFFRLKPQNVDEGDDVVTQGAAADFCFIVRYGSCDVLITTPDPTKAEPDRTTTRCVVTLSAGELVGEVALLLATVRNATVRATEPVELLTLSKQDLFTAVDGVALGKIIDAAAYKAACGKEASKRTDDDVRILKRRTSFLSERFPPSVHTQLCRLLRFSQVGRGHRITREGLKAEALHFIASGSVRVLTRNPRRRSIMAADRYNKRPQAAVEAASPPADESPPARGGSASSRKPLPSATSSSPERRRRGSASAKGGVMAVRAAVRFARGVKKSSSTSPSQLDDTAVGTLGVGECIGEAELLNELTTYMTTAVADSEEVQLFEISRAEYEAVLHHEAMGGQREAKDFFREHELLRSVAASAVYDLARLAERRIFLRGELCFAWPPEPALGPASIGADDVAFVLSGEAHLLVGRSRPSNAVLSDGAPLATPKADGERARPPGLDRMKSDGTGMRAPVLFGPLAKSAHPGNARVMAHIGVAPCEPCELVIVGAGELLHVGLLQSGSDEGGAFAWCLSPLTALDVLVLPRERWRAALGLARGGLLRCEQLIADKAAFFRQRARLLTEGLTDGTPADGERTPHELFTNSSSSSRGRLGLRALSRNPSGKKRHLSLREADIAPSPRAPLSMPSPALPPPPLPPPLPSSALVKSCLLTDVTAPAPPRGPSTSAPASPRASPTTALASPQASPPAVAHLAHYIRTPSPLAGPPPTSEWTVPSLRPLSAAPLHWRVHQQPSLQPTPPIVARASPIGMTWYDPDDARNARATNATTARHHRPLNSTTRQQPTPPSAARPPRRDNGTGWAATLGIAAQSWGQ
jgi:CRP-like cAMP-binding protein